MTSQVNDATTCSCPVRNVKALAAVSSTGFASMLQANLKRGEFAAKATGTHDWKISGIVNNRMRIFDKNHDGKIDLNTEVHGKHALLRAADNAGNGDGIVTKAELRSLLHYHDTNSSGALSLDERSRFRGDVHLDGWELAANSKRRNV